MPFVHQSIFLFFSPLHYVSRSLEYQLFTVRAFTFLLRRSVRIDLYGTSAILAKYGNHIN